MRSLSQLLSHEGRVYVYLAGENLASLFLRNAQEEGFTFGDGVNPAEREVSDIFALNRDWTISYAGFAGRMAFRFPGNSAEPLVRVDYGKYLSVREDYVMEK